MNGLKIILTVGNNTQLLVALVRTLDINCGVPQGSVLGSLLFLLYVNDIAIAISGESVKLFANDTHYL